MIVRRPWQGLHRLRHAAWRSQLDKGERRDPGQAQGGADRGGIESEEAAMRRVIGGAEPAIVPPLNPVCSQRTRCSDEPWVKLSGTTARPAARLSMSSPIDWAVLTAFCMSAAVRLSCRCCMWLAQAPAKQSAINSVRTESVLASCLLPCCDANCSACCTLGNNPTKFWM